MSTVRAVLLTALPKVLLSRTTGLLTSLPVPGRLRLPLFRWFAQRYGADLGEVDGDLRRFRSLQQFFRRALRSGARPIAPGDLVWPCDGRIVTAGRLEGGRIEQVKGRTYALSDLLDDSALAAALDGGTQATIYLAPGDYHRVHAPFEARVEGVTSIPGTLFPVNPKAVLSIRDLFARNARHVFRCRLPSGTPAAVVMVGAYNVGATLVSIEPGDVRPGDELGQFGFGSTTIVLVGPGGPPVPECPGGTRTIMGRAMGY